MMIRGRVYWATRKRFHEIVEMSAMIERVISSGGELSTLQHIFDEVDAIEKVRGRYLTWQESLGPASPPSKKPPKTKSLTSKLKPAKPRTR